MTDAPTPSPSDAFPNLLSRLRNLVPTSPAHKEPIQVPVEDLRAATQLISRLDMAHTKAVQEAKRSEDARKAAEDTLRTVRNELAGMDRVLKAIHIHVELPKVEAPKAA